jgi:hypothetical protein
MTAETRTVVNYGTGKRFMPAPALIRHLDTCLMEVKVPQSMNMADLIPTDLVA